MNVPLVISGALGIVAAGVHGGAGELLVMRKLTLGGLPSTSFGGPAMTKAMIHVSWHITTVAFFSVGVALLLAGTVLDDDAADAVALVGAAAATGFAAVAMALGAARLPLRAITRHPGPIALTAFAGFAWWGAI